MTEDQAGPSAAVQADLEAYAALLVKWNRAINLVSPGTLDAVWQRHVDDSLQLMDLCPPQARTWLDLGSGGGFPGLVIAIAARETAPELRVELVEADRRKCAFLTTVVQTLHLTAKVTPARIEALAPRLADVISARALAPLDQLLDLALPHLAPGGVCLFLKGAGIEAEARRARTAFRFEMTLYPSRTDPTGAVARIVDLSHA